jgi:hypothetical protein
MNVVLGLVWKNVDGSFTEEAWQYLGAASSDDAFDAACADGVAGEFGRVFVGVASVVDLDDHDGWNTRPFAAGGPLKARPASIVDSEPRRPRLAEIEDVAWPGFVCAFGTGTLVGVHLRRCLSADTEVAQGAAEVVGEAVAHQMTIYDVTPAATLAMGALLPHVSPAVADVLRSWLDVIAEQCAPDGDVGDGDSDDAVRASLVKEGVPDWLVDDLVARARVSSAGARGCRVSFLQPIFQTLEAGGLVGAAVVALRRSLR